jgi:hypothetical protein
MKTAVTVFCALTILTAVGTGTAFADAGVDPVAAENVRTEFEQGHFIYAVEFTANGTEYGY